MYAICNVTMNNIEMTAIKVTVMLRKASLAFSFYRIPFQCNALNVHSSDDWKTNCVHTFFHHSIHAHKFRAKYLILISDRTKGSFFTIPTTSKKSKNEECKKYQNYNQNSTQNMSFVRHVYTIGCESEREGEEYVVLFSKALSGKCARIPLYFF